MKENEQSGVQSKVRTVDKKFRNKQRWEISGANDDIF